MYPDPWRLRSAGGELEGGPVPAAAQRFRRGIRDPRLVLPVSIAAGSSALVQKAAAAARIGRGVGLHVQDRALIFTANGQDQSENPARAPLADHLAPPQSAERALQGLVMIWRSESVRA